MMEQLDDILCDEVLGPWKSECASAPYPWRATPGLRSKWRSMMRSGNRAEALCGALGLSRSSRLSEDESAGVEEFFNRKESTEFVDPWLVSSMLLSGATPPDIFLQSFLSLSLADSTTPKSWALLSKYLRHPSTARFQAEKMFPPPPPPKVEFLLGANPKRTPTANHLGIWGQCQAQFNGPRRSPSPSVPEQVLLAHAMRCDWGASELREWMRSARFARRLEDEMSGHPALQRPCPAVDHSDPSIHAIAFFSGADPVSRVWRTYSPLLIMPWLMDVRPARPSHLELVGAMMLGSLPFPASNHPSAPLSDSHPLASLAP